MQKKIIALAVAGLSTAAFAQTNVTIYGVADVSVQGQNVSKSISNQANPSEGGQMKIGNNSSLIGFKGTEDLGNGLKSLFQVETNVAMNGSSAGATNVAGANNAFPTLRDTYVGLNSKYGTALGGYLTTPYRATLTSFDVFPGATGDGRLENLLGKMYYNNAALAQFNASIRATAVAYAMPTLYGFNGSIAYTGNGNNNLTDNAAQPNSAMSFNLGWTGYGVNVAGAFQQAKYTYNATNAASAANAYTSYMLGAAYTGIAGLKAAVTYGRNSLGLNSVDANGAQKGSNNSVSAGVSYRFGNNEPALQWAHVSGTNGVVNTTNNGANQWTARWGYYMSKRTQVYGLISGLSNNNNAQYNFLNATAATGASVQGTTMTTYGVGLRTNF